MLGRLIPIAAVKSDSAVPSYPFFQNTRSAASNAFSGSKPNGRPRCATPVRELERAVERAPDRPGTARAPRLFFFVSFLILQHPIIRFITTGTKITGTSAVVVHV